MTRANDQGKLAEQQFDISARQYQVSGLIHVTACHPEFVPTRWNKGGQINGGYFRREGPPDRGIAIASMAGRLCWIEIKTWKAEKKHKLSKRLHQFEQMREAQKFGALGFYLVKWRTKKGEDWRLYPVEYLAIRDGGIVFVRQDGLEVKDSDGWPDWLPII